MGWIFLCSGLFFGFMIFCFQTENVQSSFIFKFVPFLLGLANLWAFCKSFDLL